MTEAVLTPPYLNRDSNDPAARVNRPINKSLISSKTLEKLGLSEPANLIRKREEVAKQIHS